LLKETFHALISNYTNNEIVINELWQEIEEHYSEKNRHYHTLNHIENLLNQLLEVRDKIKNWDTILFTLFYHDVIYNSLKSNNEEKSAKLAENRMRQINVSNNIIEACKSQILATKKHQIDFDSDTNYFLDADLSALGQNTENYTTYYQGVRKEYAVYPDFLYNPGRKKVLKHFSGMPRIYKTDYFYDKFELKAKNNIAYEISTL
jgi:predicted metal-dependent HD superfamily phosphohydrolase